MKKNQIINTAVIAIIASIFTYFVGHTMTKNKGVQYNTPSTQTPVHFSNYSPGGTGPDFQSAAAKSIPAVVHINTATSGKRVSQRSADPFDFFGGIREYYQPPQMGSGSGVIISPDGYIVTNNHVVNGAEEIKVTLSNAQEYTGRVVGTDPATDIAVVKIEAQNLPTLSFSNSDLVNVGQWVLAVGYPLNLDATVTAGIVSAKSRNIGINRRQSNNSVESFIQTDAAVNQGNSGGALVDEVGNLIGINSAIASPTGSYAGYSYAIPSNIAKKIVNDIIEYGEAKRAYLGIYYEPLNPQVNEKYGLASNEKGIIINEVIQGGAAQKAGLKEGDIIQMINNNTITSDPQFREKVATLKLNQPTTIQYKRNGVIKTTKVYPSDNIGKTTKRANPTNTPNRNGAPNQGNSWYEDLDLKTLSDRECRELGIDGGVEVVSTESGSRVSGMLREGFVITSVNGEPVSSVDDIKNLAKQSDGIEIGGVYKDRNGNFYIQIR